MVVFALAAIGVLVLPLRGQVISTVAGTDWLFPSSSLPALNAPLGPMKGAALDPQGNLYIADYGNSVVVRISPNGVLAVAAGNGNPGFSGDGVPATLPRCGIRGGWRLTQPGTCTLPT
jgi:serine/threonine-protein kinase